MSFVNETDKINVKKIAADIFNQRIIIIERLQYSHNILHSNSERNEIFGRT